ncbi:hypothetical protein CHS0354_002582 [Potamilus streckersoni]|uniref:Uncharacterized protein n=1 Tax=Potamilus streckersoni TaxID=2493646 RepID=A0AAE0RNW8_9BIVA|nr:hypothetical protein CHS0354_002582 [Potamilus streckersoni]
MKASINISYTPKTSRLSFWKRIHWKYGIAELEFTGLPSIVREMESLPLEVDTKQVIYKIESKLQIKVRQHKMGMVWGFPGVKTGARIETYAGAIYAEKVAQNNDNFNLNEKDLIKIQNVVDIRTEQQRMQLEIAQIREEEGQTIPQTTTPKESLDKSIQTEEKFMSHLKTHILYYLDMDNNMLESNRFFPQMEEDEASE